MKPIPNGKRILKGAAGAVALAAVSVGLGLLVRARRQPPKVDESALRHPVFSLAEFRARIASGDALVLDARGAEAYRQGHIPGAISVPAFTDFDGIDRLLAPRIKAAPDALLIVYCANEWCGMGDLLERKLIQRGYRRVGGFPGGWDAWEGGGLPVEKGADAGPGRS